MVQDATKQTSKSRRNPQVQKTKRGGKNIYVLKPPPVSTTRKLIRLNSGDREALDKILQGIDEQNGATQTTSTGPGARRAKKTLVRKSAKKKTAGPAKKTAGKKTTRKTTRKG